MSRRDTIIIAVLLNTGILAVLFMMAANPDDDRVSENLNVNYTLVESQQAPAVVEVSQPMALASSGDEVETVLKDFAATLQSESLMKQNVSSTPQQETIAMGQSMGQSMGQPVYQTQSASQKAKPQHDSSDAYVDITVKRGDSLSKIAVSNGTTIGAIKKANNLSSDNLKIGQVLHIPSQSSVTASVGETTNVKTTSHNDSKSEYYTMQSGDNPWKIAKKFQLSVNELLRMNNLDEAKARNLKPGDRIRVQ